jgi:hypothetical protein
MKITTPTISLVYNKADTSKITNSLISVVGQFCTIIENDQKYREELEFQNDGVEGKFIK